MEPYLIFNELEQVIGRSRRLCSHDMLPESMRNVSITLYILTFPFKKSQDMIMLERSIEFSPINSGFLKTIQESSIDRFLWNSVPLMSFYQQFNYSWSRI